MNHYASKQSSNQSSNNEGRNPPLRQRKAREGASQLKKRWWKWLRNQNQLCFEGSKQKSQQASKQASMQKHLAYIHECQNGQNKRDYTRIYSRCEWKREFSCIQLFHFTCSQLQRKRKYWIRFEICHHWQMQLSWRRCWDEWRRRQRMTDDDDRFRQMTMPTATPAQGWCRKRERETSVAENGNG